MKDIDESSVDDLVDALTKRCPALVIAACVADDRNTAKTQTWVSGHPATCLGLADLIHQTMRDKLAASQTHEQKSTEPNREEP